MLGPPKTRDLDRPVLISIESSVPRDHLFRHLHRVLDSSLSRIRARLGLPVFRRFLAVITEQCAQAGLISGEELLFDATNLPRGHPAPMPRGTRSSRVCTC
jgi:hypothetical protein